VYNLHIVGFFFDSKKGTVMKMLATIMLALVLTGCATVDGARTDIGTGINKVGDWVKPSKKDSK
jgi:predicted small secreted protein